MLNLLKVVILALLVNTIKCDVESLNMESNIPEGVMLRAAEEKCNFMDCIKCQRDKCDRRCIVDTNTTKKICSCTCPETCDSDEACETMNCRQSQRGNTGSGCFKEGTGYYYQTCTSDSDCSKFRCTDVKKCTQICLDFGTEKGKKCACSCPGKLVPPTKCESFDSCKECKLNICDRSCVGMTGNKNCVCICPQPCSDDSNCAKDKKCSKSTKKRSGSGCYKQYDNKGECENPKNPCTGDAGNISYYYQSCKKDKNCSLACAKGCVNVCRKFKNDKFCACSCPGEADPKKIKS